MGFLPSPSHFNSFLSPPTLQAEFYCTNNGHDDSATKVNDDITTEDKAVNVGLFPLLNSVLLTLSVAPGYLKKEQGLDFYQVSNNVYVIGETDWK